MHYRSVICSGEYDPRAAHVRGQLVYSPDVMNGAFTNFSIAEIALDKVVASV
jgi:hypothetical protein